LQLIIAQLLPRQVTEGDLGDECVLSVSCGARHTLCVTEEGEVFSFGLGHYGCLGRSYTPFQVSTIFIAVIGAINLIPKNKITGMFSIMQIEPSKVL